MILGTVRSLNAGRPRTLHLEGGAKMRSAVRKTPLEGTQPIGPDGLPGDGSQERMHHLPEMALHAFSLDRYPELEARTGAISRSRRSGRTSRSTAEPRTRSASAT